MPKLMKCPNCDAPVEADVALPTFTCGYCGYQSKHTIFHSPVPRPVPQPTPPPSLPLPSVPGPNKVASKVVRRIGCLVVFFILVSSGMTLLPFFLINKTIRTTITQVSSTASTALTSWSWVSYRPFVIDADGDGIEDVIGRIRETTGEHFLAAFGGKDFRMLWKSVQISDKTVPHLVGDKAVLTQDNILSALRLDKGEEIWSTTFSDKIKSVTLEEGKLRVQTLDEIWYLIDLASGKQSVDEQKKPPKFELRGDEGFELIPRYPQLDLKSGLWPGLEIKHAFCARDRLSRVSPKGVVLPWHSRVIYCEADLGLALATRSKGSKIPFLLGYTIKTKKKLWQRQITPPGSLEELESGFHQPRADIHGERALFLYKIHEKPYTMELVSLPDGKVLWQLDFPELQSHEHLYGAVLTAHRAYVKFGWGSMRIYDTSSGALLARLGR